MSLIKELFRKQKPRVFLGTIAVADRTDLKRHLEQEGISENETLNSALRRALTEVFSWPSAESVETALPTDLVMDIWIPAHQSGEVLDLYLGDSGITLLWRPRITVSSRLSFLVSKKTKAEFSVTKKMQWGRFLARVFSWRGFFQSQPFVRQDMELLLAQACVRLLAKMQKSL